MNYGKNPTATAARTRPDPSQQNWRISSGHFLVRQICRVPIKDDRDHDRLLFRQRALFRIHHHNIFQ